MKVIHLKVLNPQQLGREIPLLSHATKARPGGLQNPRGDHPDELNPGFDPGLVVEF